MLPSDSRPVKAGQGVLSHLNPGKSGLAGIQFSIPQKLAPVYLAFQLAVLLEDKGVALLGPASKSPHFAVPVGLVRGQPLNYGKTSQGVVLSQPPATR